MSVVWTIEERCKSCYSCIRECPAKAIMVIKGQAKVVEELCLGCGHCVRVCTQGAKAVRSGVEAVERFLKGSHPVVAMIAPSFPAGLPGMEGEQLSGALHKAGFSHVVEVAFGADLINREYYRLVNSKQTQDGREIALPLITSSCPAIYELVERTAPELVPNLAPIVSPMIAMGRVVRRCYGEEVRTVFIGPCTAKKVEMVDPEVSDAVDEVLTFAELKELWKHLDIDPAQAEPAGFDPPHAYLGRLYPVSGGLLRSAGLPFDLMNNEVVVTEGKQRVLNLLDSLKNNEVKASLVDILFCEGCISGPFTDTSLNFFTRKQKIVSYTDSLRMHTNYAEWKKAILQYQDVVIRRSFHPMVKEKPEPTEDEIRLILKEIKKAISSDELNCGACGYETCREYAKAVFQGFAEEEMCLPYVIEELQHTQKELQESLRDLAEAQEQLIQHEKLASIGQLAAGVAHEVNNPLGSIMLYAHLLLQQLKEDDQKSKDLHFIMDEAKRCQKIVAGLLNFARQGKLNLRKVALQEILDKLVSVAFNQPLFRMTQVVTRFEPDLPPIEVDYDQIYQVFLNLAVNAAEAMPEGGVLTIQAALTPDRQSMRVSFCDTGIGIPAENMNKLFTPFFTTKQIGKGTGLGLAIAYGIIKMHRGSITVRSEPHQGSTFTVELPVQNTIHKNAFDFKAAQESMK
ncbi:MAG TPA: [Fe-Fe] hydrogenase large subunit C-terminal domain-containing protein [bacterium]|nr:[Fe-Fe] hydrogenase large subunit C-terminal domain-containing protein [bacterium]HPM58265.1 [Fe-Fe] hydrogenase large subunit C-terminal domain-containing protein [bacterium]